MYSRWLPVTPSRENTAVRLPISSMAGIAQVAAQFWDGPPGAPRACCRRPATISIRRFRPVSVWWCRSCASSTISTTGFLAFQHQVAAVPARAIRSCLGIFGSFSVVSRRTAR